MEGIAVGGRQIVGLLAVGVDVGDYGAFQARGKGGVEGAVHVKEEDGWGCCWCYIFLWRWWW